MKQLQIPVLLALFATVCSCKADHEDCAELGEKFVALYEAELSEDSKKLSPEVLANAAQAGREEIVNQCKKKKYGRASVQRCLAAQTMSEFEKC